MNDHKEVRIIVTGGHHTTAMALLPKLKQELESRGFRLSVFWIGHRFSMPGDKNESLEYLEVTSLKIPFYELATPRFYGRGMISVSIKLILAIIRTLPILIKVHPSLVIAFGGYLAVPAVLAAWLLKIPSVTHEQTVSAGFANRLISKFCKRVYISFGSSARYFPKQKAVLTGNPLREEIFKDDGFFNFNNEKKTLYVTGGKQGAHRMNLLVKDTLPELLKKYNVIHQCGSVTLHQDFDSLIVTRSCLPQNQAKSYEVRQHIDSNEIGSVFARADIVLSRAGANIVCELAQLKKRSVLIPLPGSSHNEQKNNAILLEKTGLGLILEESRANPETLMKSLEEVQNIPIRTEVILREFSVSAGQILAKEIANFMLMARPA